MKLLINKQIKRIVSASIFVTLLLSVMCVGSFANAEEAISRLDTCEILYDLAKKMGVPMDAEGIKFTDTDSEAVNALSGVGIVNGVSETEFDPDGFLTREQMSTMLTRLIGKALPDVDTSIHPRYVYDDSSYVSYWAKSAVDYLYFHKIMIGTAENTISPKSNLTKEQAELLCNRVLESKDKFVLKTETPDFSWAIEPQFDGMVPDTRFACGLASVCKDGKYGYIDKTGKTVVPFKYDRTYNFSDGVAKVELNGKFGYIDKKGKAITEIIYEDGGDAYEDRIWVKKDGKVGFIDKQGKEVIPFIYDYAYEFEEGLAPVKKDGLYGYIDPWGNTVIPFKFKWASAFSEGFARVGENGRYSYIDHTGEIVIDCKYQWIYDFSEGRAVVYDLEKWGVINTKGEFVKKMGEAGWMSAASEGYIRLHPNDDYERRYGFYNLDFEYPALVDVDNQKVPMPNDANSFHEGLVAVGRFISKDDVWVRSYMDKNAECIFPKREKFNSHSDFDDDTFFLMDFSEGMAGVVNIYGELGFVNNPLF